MLANICMGDEISVVTLTQKIIKITGLGRYFYFYLPYTSSKEELVKCGCDLSEQRNRVNFF